MPKVNIDFKSPLNAKDTFEKVKDLLDNDASLRKIDSSYKCQFDDGQMSGSAKGSKFSADLKVSGNEDSANVNMCIDIPFAFALFKGQVKSILEKKLKDTLG